MLREPALDTGRVFADDDCRRERTCATARQRRTAGGRTLRGVPMHEWREAHVAVHLKKGGALAHEARREGELDAARGLSKHVLRIEDGTRRVAKVRTCDTHSADTPP